ITSCVRIVIEELITILEDQLRDNRNKRVWIRPWLARRNTHGASNMLLKELAVEDVPEYRNCMRMTPDCFNLLLQKINRIIQKTDTTMRMALPAKTKLEITLSYLATGNKVCDAIYDALKDFIKVPQKVNEWKAIESDFDKRWNYPGCYGAIDGKHITIRAPANCGSDYFNYKGQNSIILMAVVDGNYNFKYIDVGCNGRASDGGVFAQVTCVNVYLPTGSVDEEDIDRGTITPGNWKSEITGLPSI
ncbi:hypothetical protein NQ315_011427, partial [Exocentrus adspersus]